MKDIKNKIIGYYKLLDKENYGTLVVETEEAHFKVFLKEGKVVDYKRTSLIPYHLMDSDVYDMLAELTKEDFENELKLSLAKDFAKKAHAGQVDKSGVDYFEGHLTAVANGVTSTKAKIVAYLHDVIEDTQVSKEDIRELFSGEIATAVILLTKDKSTPKDYIEDYIKAIKKNPLAAEVKLSDLKHNSDPSRLKNHAKEDLERLEKYKKAIAVLES